MNEQKRKKLEAKGWKVGSRTDFLGLTPEESTIVELKLVLSKAIRQRRQAANLTQTAFAKRLNSSQSRVAKIEAGDPSVGFDLLVKSLVATGADMREIGKIIAETKP